MLESVTNLGRRAVCASAMLFLVPLLSAAQVMGIVRVDSGTSLNLEDIFIGNGLYVAVPNTNGMVVSTNGTTWQLVPMYDSPWAVTYGQGKFVAVGSGISVSTNGFGWERVTTDRQNLLGVTY